MRSHVWVSVLALVLALGFAADGLAAEGSSPPPERVVIEPSSSEVISVGHGNKAIEIVLLPGVLDYQPVHPDFDADLTDDDSTTDTPVAEPAKPRTNEPPSPAP